MKRKWNSDEGANKMDSKRKKADTLKQYDSDNYEIGSNKKTKQIPAAMSASTSSQESPSSSCSETSSQSIFDSNSSDDDDMLKSRKKIKYESRCCKMEKDSIQSSLTSSCRSVQQNEPALVFFDLETGGLKTGVDILQIAAVCGNQSFNEYVKPTRDVEPGAQEVNKLLNQEGVLMKIISQDPLDLKQLQTMPINQRLQEFVTWLDEVGSCFLVGHNVTFDERHFRFHLEKEGLLPNIKERVLGFIDTLPLYRKLYPKLHKPAGPGHSQCALVKCLLKEDYEAHDALEDVKALERLVEKTNVTRDVLMHYKISI